MRSLIPTCRRVHGEVRSLRASRLPRPLRPLRAHWIPAEDTVVPEFLQLSLQFVCPDNILDCSGLPIPEPDTQMDMVRTFLQVRRTIHLHGFDAVVWKWIVEGRDDSLELLLHRLAAFHELMHSIQDMVVESSNGE